MTSLTKKTAPPRKTIFFECNLLDWPIRLTAEQLSSATGGGAMALVRQPKTAVFLQKSPKPGGSKSVNNIAGSEILKKKSQEKAAPLRTLVGLIFERNKICSAFTA